MLSKGIQLGTRVNPNLLTAFDNKARAQGEDRSTALKKLMHDYIRDTNAPCRNCGTRVQGLGKQIYSISFADLAALGFACALLVSGRYKFHDGVQLIKHAVTLSHDLEANRVGEYNGKHDTTALAAVRRGGNK